MWSTISELKNPKRYVWESGREGNREGKGKGGEGEEGEMCCIRSTQANFTGL